MTALVWRAIDRHALADMIAAAGNVSAEAVGGATVYRLDAAGQEILVVAPADGPAVVIERAAPINKRRRRQSSVSIT